MEIQHRKSLKIHQVSQEQWDKMGSELQMQKDYKVISNVDYTSNKISLPEMKKPLIQKVPLNKPLDVAIYEADFDSTKYSVKQINAFLGENEDKKEYFAKDNRSTINK